MLPSFDRSVTGTVCGKRKNDRLKKHEVTANTIRVLVWGT